MNEQPKFKYVREVSKTDASRRARTVIRTKRPVRRRYSADLKWPSAAINLRVYPARGLMVCLGWLRLFRAVVSEGVSAPTKLFAHEV